MTPEEFERFKEAEKDHLRKIRDLKKANKQFVQQSKNSRAVTDMATGMNELYDEHREMLDRLQMGTLQNEARMEVALDSVDMDPVSEAQDAAALEADMEAIKKARAKELIRQMKLEGSSSTENAAKAPVQSAPVQNASSQSSPSGSSSRTPLSEKPKPTTSSDLPEKTIGRMKP
ncbi:hypothetical protein HQ496_06530 [bacterium]|nr:hypothetical protein [bacterium]